MEANVSCGMASLDTSSMDVGMTVFSHYNSMGGVYARDRIQLKARVWNSKIPTGQQLNQYGKRGGLILSLLSYQFEFYWLLLDCKQKHMVAINIVC